MRTSYSALNTFKQCPQRFKFQIIDKIKAPRSPEAMFGSSVHGAMKFIFSHDPLFPTLDEVLGHFSENWKSSAGKSSKQLPVELVQVYEESGGYGFSNVALSHGADAKMARDESRENKTFSLFFKA